MALQVPYSWLAVIGSEYFSVGTFLVSFKMLSSSAAKDQICIKVRRFGVPRTAFKKQSNNEHTNSDSSMCSSIPK